MQIQTALSCAREAKASALRRAVRARGRSATPSTNRKPADRQGSSATSRAGQRRARSPRRRWRSSAPPRRAARVRRWWLAWAVVGRRARRTRGGRPPARGRAGLATSYRPDAKGRPARPRPARCQHPPLELALHCRPLRRRRCVDARTEVSEHLLRCESAAAHESASRRSCALRAAARICSARSIVCSSFSASGSVGTGASAALAAT